MAPSAPAFLRNIEWKRFVADPIPFLLVWVLGGVLTVVIPRRVWVNKRNEYYEYAGYAIEYQQAQRQNNQNNQNNNVQYQIYNGCSWWNYNCRKKMAKYMAYWNSNNNNNNNNREEESQVPNWYRFMGGSTEEERRQREQGGQSATDSNGALKFVNAWSMTIFLLLVVYGVVAVYRKHNLNTCRWCLFMFANVSLLLMILCVQGVIETDGRAMQDTVYGWYGQPGVLMVFSCFGYMIFSLLGAIAVSIRMCWLARTAATPETKVEGSSESLFTKPKVSVTQGESGTYHEYKEMA